MNKSEIRQEILNRRRLISSNEQQHYSLAVNTLLTKIPAFCAAKNFMTYLSLPDEIQTDEMIAKAMQAGKQVCVPMLRKQAGLMDAVIIESLADVGIGKFGLRVPNKGNCTTIDPVKIDIVIVPGLAFDLQGNRIGFGKGYYDRFLPLASNAVYVGVAWPFQILSHIPVSQHDVQMHFVLTGEEIYPCYEGRM